MPRGGPVPGPVAPGYGYPVLSHPATVPSQMPLRRAESHSERFLDVGQYETHTSPLEAVYGPYSTSAPLHSTIDRSRRSTARHGARVALSPVSSGPPGVAILTALTRQKSHHERPFSTAKEIGCYRQRGGGRGCDPAHAHRALAVLGPAPAFPQEINAMVLSTNPAPALSGPCCWTSFL